MRDNNGLMSRQDVQDFLKISRSSVYRFMDNPRDPLPRPLRFGPKTLRWQRDKIVDYVQRHDEERTPDPEENTPDPEE